MYETPITIVGNLTADPELRTTRDGGRVVNLTIASTPRSYNRQSGQWQDGDTLFLRCNAWDTQYSQLATNITNTLAKGMNVIAQGDLSQRSYQTQQGENRTVYEMRIRAIGPNLTRQEAAVEKTGQPASTGGNSYGGRNTPPPASPQPQSPQGRDEWAAGDEFGEPEF